MWKRKAPAPRTGAGFVGYLIAIGLMMACALPVIRRPRAGTGLRMHG